MSTEHVISVVGEADLEDLLPLLRGYCDFYEVAPSDDALLAVSRALIADPEREGLQLIGRGSADGRAVGFATLYWTWQTLNAARLGVMNDLFVAEEARGSGLADRLIAACRERSADPRRARARVADRQGQPPRAEGLRPHRRPPSPSGWITLCPSNEGRQAIRGGSRRAARRRRRHRRSRRPPPAR